MTDAARQLLQAALELPQEERETLTIALLDSMGAQDPAVIEHAWKEEIQRRIRALEHGEVKAIPWEEARRRIFAH